MAREACSHRRESDDSARSTRAHRAVQTLLCGWGQLVTRSSSVRLPKLCRMATAPGRRLRLRTVGALRSTAVAHGPRAHSPVEAQTTAHRARECTAQYRLGCVAGANLRPAPAQVLGRGSAARPPHQVGGSGFVPSALPRPTLMARSSCSNRSVENRTTAHGARTPALRGADLVVWLGPTRDALLPSSLVEAPPHGYCIRSAAATSDCRRYRAQLPWRTDCAVIAPSRIGRPPTKRTRALRGADLVVWLGPTRNALLLSSLAEALRLGHCIRSAAAA